MEKANKTTVIICCAGMGTRLGIGTTKALVDVSGKPLIIRQLEQLAEYDDIRIVVGFDAERVIQTVKEYRQDIMFVFNYDYEHTGTADSLRRALLGANDLIIALDGDIVLNAHDFQKFLKYDGECLGVSENATCEPIIADIENGKVVKLKKGIGDVQWSGVIKIKKNRLDGQDKHVYDMLNTQLPLDYVGVRLKEINTQEDYDKAIMWYENGCCG